MLGDGERRKGRKLGLLVSCLVRSRSLGFRSAITRPKLSMTSRGNKWKGRGVKGGLEN